MTELSFTARRLLWCACLLLPMQVWAQKLAPSGGNGALLDWTPNYFTQTQPGDGYALALALEGETAVITAYRHSTPGSQLTGVAYIYEHSAGGWAAPVVIQTGNPAVPNHFATSVALSGNRMVLGAYNDYLGGGPRSADIFQKIAGGWVHEAELTTANATLAFGVSVAIDGDVVVVGDSLAETATVFNLNAGQWLQTQQLQPSLIAGERTRFGDAVAVEGDLLAVGRPYYPSFASRKGAVYLYRRTGNTWAGEYQFELQDGGGYPEMGERLVIDQGRVLAGAGNYSLAAVGGPRIGAAFVLEKVGPAWTSTRLLSSSPASSHFGQGVALQGDVAIIGAPRESGTGRLYSFVRSGPGQWGEVQKVGLDSLSGDPQLGATLAISGERVLAAAPWAQPALAFELSTSPVEAPGISFSVAAPYSRSCPIWGTRSTVVRWSSDASSCRALDGNVVNSSWGQAACGPPLTCPNPRNFRVLAPSGSALVTLTDVSYMPSGVDTTLVIECTGASGRASRATISLSTRYEGMDTCPMPSHSLGPTLTSGPVALANGTFELRAAISNPEGRSLTAIARQYSAAGTAHARIEGGELVMLFSPDETVANPPISNVLAVAVSDGEVAVERSYPFSLDLTTLFKAGFE